MITGPPRTSEDIQPSFMTGKTLGEISIELEEESHHVMTDLTLGESGRGRMDGINPCLYRRCFRDRGRRCVCREGYLIFTYRLSTKMTYGVLGGLLGCVAKENIRLRVVSLFEVGGVAVVG